MVNAAHASMSALIDALLPLAEAGIAVVGLEPNCLLTLRDEALALNLGLKAGKPHTPQVPRLIAVDDDPGIADDAGASRQQ